MNPYREIKQNAQLQQINQKKTGYHALIAGSVIIAIHNSKEAPYGKQEHRFFPVRNLKCGHSGI